jgi:hypothetical protein
MELNWDNAHLWQAKSNCNKIEQEPKWSWDCGFKLDFDGELMSIESRFYPPHKNNVDKWQGGLRVILLGNEILEKTFECDTLEELKKEVEKFTKHYKEILKSRLK